MVEFLRRCGDYVLGTLLVTPFLLAGIYTKARDLLRKKD